MSRRPPPLPSTRALLVLALLAASAACANTKVKREWSDPGLKEDRYQKVMVVVAVPAFGRRQTAEDRIVAELAREGVNAVRSWDVLPHEEIVDRERIRAAVEASGADALLAVRLTSSEKESQVSEGREQWVPVGTGIDSFGYVTNAYGLYRKPEVYDVRVFTVETTLWEVATQHMVWAAQSDSETADQTLTTAELADDYAKVVAKRVVPYFKRK